MGSSLSIRHRQAEIQDQPDLDRPLLVQALRGLERLNRWCDVSRTFWPAIRDLGKKVGGAPLRVLDVATGAGDLPIRLWHLGHRAGIALEIEGCDLNPYTVEYAREQAEKQQAAVRFFTWDALSGPIPSQYDVVVSSLFFHHLGEEHVVALLQRMADASRQMVLVHDLIRSRPGWLLAYVGTRLLLTSRVNQVDGPRSVESAFTLEEFRLLVQRAGLASAKVEKRWPSRFLMRWKKEEK